MVERINWYLRKKKTNPNHPPTLYRQTQLFMLWCQWWHKNPDAVSKHLQTNFFINKSNIFPILQLYLSSSEEQAQKLWRSNYFQIWIPKVKPHNKINSNWALGRIGNTLYFMPRPLDDGRILFWDMTVNNMTLFRPQVTSTRFQVVSPATRLLVKTTGSTVTSIIPLNMPFSLQADSCPVSCL